MKKWAITLLMLFCLTGCDASSEIERGMALRSALLKAESCSFDAVITADYQTKSHRFRMSCTCDNRGDLSFTVLEPENISDITGKINSSGGALTFDETALYFDPMTDEQLSPVSAPWVLMKALRSGYITSACEEKELLWLSIDDSYDDDALHVDIWLNGDGVPVHGEIVCEGRRILSLDVENFVIS